ncbi:hypothetical protein T11_7646, partial [Trichinella zimbabwensis]
LWLVICKISLQWHRPLKAVLAYALALRGGGSGLDLALHVFNAWHPFEFFFFEAGFLLNCVLHLLSLLDSHAFI